MDKRLVAVLDGFLRNQGSPLDVINTASALLQCQLPADYIEILQYMDGGEGFVGSEYIRLYPSKKLAELNSAYGVREFAPGLVIFGSNGRGEAYAFDYRQNRQHVVRVPFIPMDLDYLEVEGPSLAEFLLNHADPKPRLFRTRRKPNPELIGKEIHEIMPVVFGGSPVDPKNKVFLEPESYAEYVMWWNRKYQELKGHTG